MERLTKNQKSEILYFVGAKDEDSHKIGITMARTYLLKYPNEKNFIRKLKRTKRERNAVGKNNMQGTKP